MNREAAETYLRVLAETEMRGPVMPDPRPSWPGAPDEPGGPGGGIARLAAVAQVLTAVSAIDAATAADIMADFDLAVGVRQNPAQPGPGPAGATGGTASVRPRPGRIRFPGTGPMTPVGGLPRTWRRAGPPPPPGSSFTSFTGAATGSQNVPAGPRSPATEPAERPDQGGPDRFVPVGLTVPFRGEGSSGEMYLMSYAHTACGARFFIVWRILSPHHPVLTQPDPFFEQLTVTDDRGGRYDLDFAGSGGPECSGQISLRPEPPADIRWLDIAAPGDPAVRVGLGPADSGAAGSPDGAGPEFSERPVSPGEHLLTRLAERLLTIAPELPPDLRLRLAAVSPGPFDGIARGLGDVIAALEAAEVLSPLSPVPGRLAALCASLGITGHGITVPPALDLPEPWLSLLVHYQRRKPDAAQVRDGYAAVGAALPELDGVRLAVLGLHNTDGGTWIQALAKGLMPEGHHGPFGFDMYFPLSVWIRDSGGRWHAARPSGWHRADGEYALKLQLVPPLPRSTAWIEVRAAGQSAQARARLPLRWRCPP